MTDSNTDSRNGDIPVITVDGPSGVGKGTLAKTLAAKYGFHYLDSGAIYRVVALEVLQRGLDSTQIEEIVECATHLQISFPAEQNTLRTAITLILMVIFALSNVLLWLHKSPHSPLFVRNY